MKISPMSSSGLTIGAISTGADAPQSMTEKVRALKMKVNVTPGRIEIPPPPDPALPIADASIDSAVDDATQPLSPQFAALAKQRRALQQEKQAFEREKAETAKAKQDVASVDLARLKSDPLGVLQEAGIGYEQLTEAVLANQNGDNPKVRELEAKIAALEAGLDKKLADKDSQSEQAALAEMRKEANQISSQGDDFELIRETGSVPDVMRLIEQTYRKSGEVLDVREAMGLIEEELIKDGLKIAGLKKVQSKFAPAPLPPPQQQQRQMRTLTNRDTAQVPMDRKQRALLAWSGNLKK